MCVCACIKQAVGMRFRNIGKGKTKEWNSEGCWGESGIVFCSHTTAVIRRHADKDHYEQDPKTGR